MCPYEDRRAPPPPGVYWTPPPPERRTTDHAPAMPMSERRRPPSSEKRDPFHVVHKVPSGDSPYVRAKHAQVYIEFYAGKLIFPPYLGFLILILAKHVNDLCFSLWKNSWYLKILTELYPCSGLQ